MDYIVASNLDAIVSHNKQKFANSWNLACNKHFYYSNSTKMPYSSSFYQLKYQFSRINIFTNTKVAHNSQSFASQVKTANKLHLFLKEVYRSERFVSFFHTGRFTTTIWNTHLFSSANLKVSSISVDYLMNVIESLYWIEFRLKKYFKANPFFPPFYPQWNRL